MFAQLREPFEVRLKEHSSAHLEPMLITQHDLYSSRFLTGFDTSPHFPPTAVPLFLI